MRINARTPYYSSGQLLRYRTDDGIWPSALTAEVFSTREELDQHLRDHGTSLDKEATFFGQDPSALDGEMVMKRGRFEHCRAVGWVIPEYGRAQISINLTDFHVTNMHHVFDACRQLAEDRGLVITGSELVGVAPYPAIRASGEHYLSNQGSSRGIPVQDIIATAVQSLGLCDISNFDPERSVIGLPTTSGPLTSQTVDGFVDEVSRDSPAPGGGSIAALAGSLGAALSSMVANLTFTKRKYRKRRAEMETIAIEAQRLKDDLLRAVDEDTEAFESVIAALRLPQGTPEQEKIRAVAIEAGYRHAIEVPLNSAELCLEVMRLALKAAHRGLPAGVTDAGTAVWMARAGFEGAILNVRINLSEIKDEKWRSAIEERILLLRKDAESLLEQCQQQLEEILGS